MNNAGLGCPSPTQDAARPCRSLTVPEGEGLGGQGKPAHTPLPTQATALRAPGAQRTAETPWGLLLPGRLLGSALRPDWGSRPEQKDGGSRPGRKDGAGQRRQGRHRTAARGLGWREEQGQQPEPPGNFRTCFQVSPTDPAACSAHPPRVPPSCTSKSLPPTPLRLRLLPPGQPWAVGFATDVLVWASPRGCLPIPPAGSPPQRARGPQAWRVAGTPPLIAEGVKTARWVPPPPGLLPASGPSRAHCPGPAPGLQQPLPGSAGTQRETLTAVTGSRCPALSAPGIPSHP